MIQPWTAPDPQSILSDEEIQRVIISTMEGMDGEVSESDLKLAVDWAAKAKIGGMLYDMIQTGHVAIAGLEGPDNPLITVREEVLGRVREAFKIIYGDEA